MRRSWVTLGMVAACVGLAYGCGDDDDNGGGQAGTSGVSGRGGAAAGRGGTGGSAASGGRAGTSGRGSSNGGASGRGSTSGGSSATAEGGASGQAGGGAAGIAAASGQAGGGAGGEAPVCDVRATPHKLSTTCAVVPVWEPDNTSEDTVTTNCSFESACKAFGCGGLWSPYDAHMCRRPLCHSSAECGTGERCVAPPLLGDFNCYFDPISSPAVNADCSCEFEQTECAPRAYCLSAAEYPAESDCDVAHMTCEQLGYLYYAPFDYLSPLMLDGTSDLSIALGDCESKIHTAYAACQGGAGGEGGGHSQ